MTAVNGWAFDLVRKWESCSLTAYRDTGSPPVWTIGWGYTQGVKEGMTCSQDEADAWLHEELLVCERDIRVFLPLGLSEQQIGALVSFAYNLGESALKDSTLLGMIKQGDWVNASRQFVRWTKDDGREVRGLMRRRLAEAVVFVDGSTW